LNPILPLGAIAHWFVGKRTKENAVEFLRGLKRRINARIQLSSDAWQAYHSYLGAVFQVFRGSIDYGTEMKYFAKTPGLGPDRRENPVVLQWIRRQVKIGHPDPHKITTAHVERTNLSARLFDRRFTRKTLGYSKKLANLKHAVALLVAHFDFCRVHSAHGQTPAMAAGLTDHV
jgi:IS1 family transposase